MTQGMEGYFGQVMAFQEFGEPFRYRIGINGFSVALGKQPVCIHPAFSYTKPPCILPYPVIFQQSTEGRTERQLPPS